MRALLQLEIQPFDRFGKGGEANSGGRIQVAKITAWKLSPYGFPSRMFVL